MVSTYQLDIGVYGWTKFTSLGLSDMLIGTLPKCKQQRADTLPFLYIEEVIIRIVYVVKQKCTTLPPIKFGVLVRIINKKVYLHYDNKKEFFSKS